ncbi:MAG: PLP-dependent aminotransferase family protein [Clostridiales bacterium]|nr:PLP-dependent aminotransferase family protein [Clostridiales bacterium]
MGTRTNRNKNLYDDLNNFERYTNFTDVSKIEAVPLETLRENANKREGYRYLKDYDLVEKKKERKELDDFNYLFRNTKSNYNLKETLEEARETREKDEFLVDFSLSGVDMDYFPYSKWRKLTKECLIDDNKELFLSGEHQGDLKLRQAVQMYLHQARGVKCNVDQIVIGAGSDYMLLLLSRIMAGQKTVAMENPTYKQAYTIFESVGYSVVPISMDEQGMQIDELRKSQAQIAYVTPSHQFPLGTIMSANRKRQLLAWASGEEGRYIIEDDYDSEFRYSGKPIPALQSQDPFEKVIYVGTLSKVIAPAIRLSYMVLPQSLLQAYYEHAEFYFSTVSRIDQQVIGQFFLEGHFERHLNRMRKVYRMKHDCLVQELKNAGFGAQIEGESAGLHLLLGFGTRRPDAGDVERRLVKAAAGQQVKVYALGEYYITEEERVPTILLGFARLKEKEIIDGVARLTEAWKEQEGLICTE